jgi:hypothetical protein
MSVCTICEQRKSKRSCPGLNEKICPQCCAEQREVTISCPLDCGYLIDARRFEKPPSERPDLPFPELKLTSDFLNDRYELLETVAFNLGQSVELIPGLYDKDIKEALSAEVQTLKTAESGLIYQTKPDNVMAGAVQERLQIALQQFRTQKQQETGMFVIKDSDIAGILVYLYRILVQIDNGRPRGRNFIGFVYDRYRNTA